MKLLFRWAVSALALLLISEVVPGVHVSGIYSALVAALALGAISLTVRPALVFLTLPVTILTLGLFLFVVHALSFWFASTLVKGFFVDGFVPAFWGALLFAFIQLIFDQLFSPRYVRR